MGLFDSITYTFQDMKRKSEMKKAQAAAEAKRKETEEIQEKANTVRAGADAIIASLDSLKFDNFDCKLPMETRQRYAEIVRDFRNVLKYAPFSTMDTEEIDSQILGLIGKLQTNVDNGNEQVCDRIFEYMAKAILSYRREINTGDEESDDIVLKNREKSLKDFNQLAKLYGSYEETDKTIQNLKADEEKTKREYELALAAAQEAYDKYPEQADELEKIQATGAPVPAKLLHLSRLKEEAVSLYNKVENISSTIGIRQMENAATKSAIDALDLELKTIDDSNFQLLSKEIEQMKGDFQENMRSLVSSVLSLSGLSNEFRNIMINIMASEELKNHVVKVDMKFNEMMKERENEQKARANAAQRMKQDNELRQKNAASMQTNEPVAMLNED